MAAPQARRELELRLKVTTDAVVAKAGMDQLAQSAERAERAASKAQRAATAGRVVGGAGVAGMSGVVGGTAAAGAAAAGGVTAFGAALAARFGLPTGTLTAAAGGAALAYQSIKTSKSVADAYQDELLTEGQRGRRIVGSVIGGSTFLDYADTITGRGRDMARAGEEGERAAAVSAARMQFRGTQLGLQGGVTSAQARADVMAGARAQTVPYVDRSTAEGERQFRLETQRAQVRERVADADRESAVARKEAEGADRRATDLAKEAERIDRRRADVQRRIGRTEGSSTPTWLRAVTGPLTAAGIDALDTDGPERLRRQQEFDRLGGERQANAQQQAEQLRAVQEARNRQIAAESRATAARRVGEFQIQAGDLEERAARATSNAQRVALSDRDRVQEAIYAAERFKRGGLRSLDPSEIGLLQEFGSEDLKAAAEKEGRNDPRLRRLAGLLPQTYPDGAADPESLRRGANEARNRAAEAQIEADRDAATRTAETVKSVADVIERVFLRAMEQVEANVLNRQRTSRGAQ